MIKAIAVSQTLPHSLEVRKLMNEASQEEKETTQPPWLRKLACRQEFHGLCKMLSKSLKPVFHQVTPNGAVPGLCKAKTPRANLPERRDLQPRAVVLLPADERLHRAKYSG